jgi:hypothetical protein
LRCASASSVFAENGVTFDVAMDAANAIAEKLAPTSLTTVSVVPVASVARPGPPGGSPPAPARRRVLPALGERAGIRAVP